MTASNSSVKDWLIMDRAVCDDKGAGEYVISLFACAFVITWRGEARPGKPCQGGRGKAGSGRAGPDSARRGAAGHRKARRGVAGPG